MLAICTPFFFFLYFICFQNFFTSFKIVNVEFATGAVGTSAHGTMPEATTSQFPEQTEGRVTFETMNFTIPTFSTPVQVALKQGKSHEVSSLQ